MDSLSPDPFARRDPPELVALNGARRGAASVSSALIYDGDGPIAPPDNLVRGVLPKSGLAFLAGQPGAGKSFVALHLALCLATGRPFFGHDVRERVGTVILAAEGAGGMLTRIRAAREAAGEDQPLPVAFHPAPPILSEGAEIEALVEVLEEAGERFKRDWGVPLGLVVVDTLAAGAALGDENDNAEASRICRVLRALGERVGVLVLAVHHVGKNAESGLRGASAWNGAADAVLIAASDKDPETGEHRDRRLSVVKSRESSTGLLGTFELVPVALATDDDGQPFGSAAVEEGGLGAAAGRTRAKERPSPSASVFLDALHEALIEHGVRRHVRGEPDAPMIRMVDAEHVKRIFARLYPDAASKEPDTIRRTCDRAMQTCRDRRFAFTETTDGVSWWYVPKDDGAGDE